MYHPYMTETIAAERMRELESEARRAHLLNALRRPQRQPPVLDNVLLRLCRTTDGAALDRLAALSERRRGRGTFVVAETDGELVAALPLDGGDVLYDPFRPTAQIVKLLQLRAAQITKPTRPGRLARLRAAVVR